MKDTIREYSLGSTYPNSEVSNKNIIMLACANYCHLNWVFKGDAGSLRLDMEIRRTVAINV
jgi:hypothetical protein